MRDRRVLSGFLVALSLLAFGNQGHFAYAAGPDPVVPIKQPHPSLGYDVSFPQCPRPLPGTSFAFAMVGVTEGIAFSTNDCLHDQFAWAEEATNAAPGLYLNLNAVMYVSLQQAMSGPKGKCAWVDGACQAYNYGYNTAQAAFEYAAKQGATTQLWWLDVEWQNFWTYDYTLNDLTIQGAIDYIVSKGSAVGIYSTQFQWNYIAGPRYVPTLPAKSKLPIWLATVEKASTAAGYCSADNAFAGGTIWYVQYPGATFDEDHNCLN